MERQDEKKEKGDLSFETVSMFTTEDQWIGSKVRKEMEREREKTDWLGGRKMMCSHLSYIMENPIDKHCSFL